MNKIYICHDCGELMREKELITVNTSWEEYYCAPIETRTPYTYKTCPCGSHRIEKISVDSLIYDLEKAIECLTNNPQHKIFLREFELYGELEGITRKINSLIKKVKGI